MRGQQLVLFKIAMDRLLYGPAFNAVQMAFVYTVSGQNPRQVLNSLKNTYMKAQILNFKMWPFAQVGLCFLCMDVSMCVCMRF